MPVELALANAIASVEMEGFHLSQEGYSLCYQYCNGEISWEQFMESALLLAEKNS